MKTIVKKGPKGPMNRRFESAACALAYGVYLAVSSDLSLKLLGDLRHHRYKDIIDTSVNPNDYLSSSAFADDYLCTSLMSKFPEWDLGIDRTQVAIDRFIESERVCAEANHRLNLSYVNGLRSSFTPESIIHEAQCKIARLLGSFSWDLAEPFFSFGKGATSSLNHRKGDAYYKYGEKPHVTADAAILAYTAICRVPIWYSRMVSLTGIPVEDFEVLPLSEKIAACIEIEPGNRVTTVPKDAKKDRVIAIEPTMNSYVQKGIGGLIRHRLRRVGVDLNDQRKNQRLAKLGSIRGDIATVDLSSASDSVSLGIVRRLLPPDWVAAIEMCRSSKGVLPSGEEIIYQKVSSMGNGFTFELESLIFWALSSSVMSALKLDGSSEAWGECLPSIYGDDIVIPSSAVHTLGFILKFCGFSFNSEKTFSAGPFRESCGKHYFNGDDVTPLYVRKDVTTPDRLIWFANQIRRWSRLSWGLDGRFKFLYDYCISILPEGIQRSPSIPDGYGDYGLIGDFDEVRPRRRCGFSNHNLVDMWLPLRKSLAKGDSPYLIRQLALMNDGPELEYRLRVAIALHSAGATYIKEKWFPSESYGVVLPSDVKWHVVKDIPVTQWPSYGPWLIATA